MSQTAEKGNRCLRAAREAALFRRKRNYTVVGEGEKGRGFKKKMRSLKLGGEGRFESRLFHFELQWTIEEKERRMLPPAR